MKKPTVSGILKKIRGTSHRVADDLATVKHTLITAELIEKLSSAGYKVVKDELPVAGCVKVEQEAANNLRIRLDDSISRWRVPGRVLGE